MDLNVDSIYKVLLTEAIEKGKVIDAIKTNTEVTIFYAGDRTINKGYRVIQPFCFGVNQNGNPCIRAWQRTGTSDTPNGKPNDDLSRMPGWRMFRLDGISTFNKTSNKFDISKSRLDSISYNPDDKDMATIYAAVSASIGGNEPSAQQPTNKPVAPQNKPNQPSFKPLFNKDGNNANQPATQQGDNQSNNTNPNTANKVDNNPKADSSNNTGQSNMDNKVDNKPNNNQSNPDSNQTSPNTGIGGGFFKNLKDTWKRFFKE
jgi:hypothetical protein